MGYGSTRYYSDYLILNTHTHKKINFSFAQAATNVLTELDLSIVEWEKCNLTIPNDDATPNGIIESQICAKDYEKNRDTCQVN